MFARVTAYLPAASGAVAVGVSAMTLIEWLRVLVLLVGLVGTVVAIFWNWRKSRLEARDLESHLCWRCRYGFRPKTCPIPLDDRPEECPLNPSRRAAAQQAHE